MTLSLEYLRSEYLEKLKLYLEVLAKVEPHNIKFDLPPITKDLADLDSDAATIETYFEVFYEAEILLSSMKVLSYKYLTEDNARKIRTQISQTAAVRAERSKEINTALIADFEKLLRDMKHKYWPKSKQMTIPEIISIYKKNPEHNSKQLCTYLLNRVGASKKIIYETVNNAGLELTPEIIPNFGKNIEFRIYPIIDLEASKLLNLESVGITNGLNRDTIRKFGTIIEVENSDVPPAAADIEDIRRRIAIGKITNDLIMEKMREDRPINRIAIATEYEGEMIKSRERKRQQQDVQARKLRSGETVLESLDKVFDIYDLFRINKLENIQELARKFKEPREKTLNKIINDKYFTRVTKMPYQILNDMP